MGLLLENNTSLKAFDDNIAFEDATDIALKNQYSYRLNNPFINNIPDVDHFKSDFNILRADAVGKVDSKKLDAVRAYKKHKANCVLFSNIFFSIILCVVGICLDLDRIAFEIGLVFCLFVGSVVGNIIAKMTQKNNCPQPNDVINYNYRFMDEYILMKTEYDSKVLRYNGMRAAEDESAYYIYCDLEKYTLDKKGFSKHHKEFTRIMEDKGIRVELYIGQF